MTHRKSIAPVFEQGWLRAIIFFAAYVGATLLAGMAAVSGLAVAIARKGGTIDMQTMGLVAIAIVSITGILLSIVFRIYLDRQPVRSLGFSPDNLRENLYAGLLLGVVIIGGGALILYANGNLQWVDGAFQGGQFFLLLAAMMLLAVSEEMVFRGYILNNLMETLDRRIALGASAVLFAMAHSFNPGLTVIAVINLLLGGVLLGINFIYTRQLWFAIGLHFSWNFLQGPVLGFAVSGLEEYSILEQELKGNPLLTGHRFGFEGSFIATLLLLAAIIVLYAVYEMKEKVVGSER